VHGYRIPGPSLSNHFRVWIIRCGSCNLCLHSLLLRQLLYLALFLKWSCSHPKVTSVSTRPCTTQWKNNFSNWSQFFDHFTIFTSSLLMWENISAKPSMMQLWIGPGFLVITAGRAWHPFCPCCHRGWCLGSVASKARLLPHLPPLLYSSSTICFYPACPPFLCLLLCHCLCCPSCTAYSRSLLESLDFKMFATWHLLANIFIYACKSKKRTSNASLWEHALSRICNRLKHKEGAEEVKSSQGG